MSDHNCKVADEEYERLREERAASRSMWNQVAELVDEVERLRGEQMQAGFEIQRLRAEKAAVQLHLEAIRKQRDSARAKNDRWRKGFNWMLHTMHDAHKMQPVGMLKDGWAEVPIESCGKWECIRGLQVQKEAKEGGS